MSMRPLQASRPAWLAAIGALAAAYFLTARWGLSLGVAEQVTAFWPPTGIALAALLTFGRSLWPGIWIGAFLANLAASEPLGTALGIATGNTLEAIAAAWLLRRAGFSHAIDRLWDVFALVLLAAFVATAISASIGVTSLCLGGVQPWSRFEDLWLVWWLGDAMGALLVAPVLLTWQSWRRARWNAARSAEFATVLIGLAITSSVVFGQTDLERLQLHPYGYVLFPFVIWAALRFGQQGSSLAVLASSIIAVLATVHGLDSLGTRQVSESLVNLQGYMGVVATTGLMLGAAVSERNRADRHRAAGYAIASILNESATLEQATPRILRAICDSLDFDLGAVWTVDRKAGMLRCVELWHRPGIDAAEFSASTRQRTFAPGIGLPGRVWSTARAAWIEDVVEDTNFPRAPVAEREGLHGAFGFPILGAGEVLGVIEFFSREIRTPDEKLLQLLGTVGHQIGQYIERREAEEAVRISEARKAGVLASVLDAIVTIDHQGRLIEFNAGAEQIFGYRAADAIGRELAELIVPPRWRERHRTGLARYVATGEGTLLDRRTEMQALRADGSEFPVEMTIWRVIGSQPPMITGYLRDITVRNRTEEERARLLAREQEARARAEALAEDLREQQAAKDRFLAMLGHELRNPLAPVTNVLEILRQRGGSAEDQELVAMMSRQVKHMARLVDDLLDVSRISRGGVAVRLERLELGRLVANALEASRPSLDAKGHRLALSLCSEPLWIVGDPTRIEQIVSNLISNAERYTPRDGEIAVTLSREGGDALLAVRDDGIGIRPELLPQIFEAFQQGDHVPGSMQQGLGLGLTLVRSLAELHGGSVKATSRGPGQGSEFTVRFPLAESGARRAE
jgi:PAS domain S-box-containing protein